MDTILNLGITDEVEDGLGRACPATRLRPRRPTCASSTSSAQTVLGADLDRARRRRDRRRRSAPRCADDTGERGARPIRTSSSAPRSAPSSAPGPRGAPRPTARHWGIPEDGGTAVIVQAMVFGNLGERLGHRRALQPRPAERRPRAVRRVAAGRAGRGRRQRHPRPAAAGGAGGRAARRPRASCSRPRRCSSARTATSRTSSSRSRAAGSTCCRRARPSARRSPPCAPPSTSPPRARSTAPRRSAGSAPSSWPPCWRPRLHDVGDRRGRGAGARHRRLPGRRRGRGGRRTPTRPRPQTATRSSPVRRPAPRTSAGHDRRARRGHRARRLDLARRGRHPRARAAERGRRGRRGDRRLDRARADRRRQRRASSTPECWPTEEVAQSDVPGLEAADRLGPRAEPGGRGRRGDRSASTSTPKGSASTPTRCWTPTSWPRACAAPTP